jgi:RNA polymerase sigma factor (sigma-70 family)
LAQDVIETTLNVPAAAPGLEAGAAGDDVELVKKCLAGHEEAWTALIRKYKRLIYSVPFRYGMGADDAADIFQAVCLDLFTELENLRRIESLRSWIITVTIHKSFHWKRQRRATDVDIDALEPEQADAIGSVPPPADLERFEKEQIVREAVTQLPARCVEMVRLLFYREPPLAYVEVARRLGLATGSIGFIRGRCLQRLEKILDSMRF